MLKFRGCQLILILVIGLIVFWIVWPNAVGLIVFGIILCIYVIVVAPNDPS